jgi:hypothetical protein
MVGDEACPVTVLHFISNLRGNGSQTRLGGIPEF